MPRLQAGHYVNNRNALVIVKTVTLNKPACTMKYFLSISASILFSLALVGWNNNSPQQGAWMAAQGQQEQWVLLKDNYCTWTAFDKTNKKFIRSFGGPVSHQQNGTAILTIEFDTQHKDEVGKKLPFNVTSKGSGITLDLGTGETKWMEMDNGQGALSGNWRITGRMQGGEISTIARGDRKTLKLLTGTRFQWIAINPATREFFGTGGGSYTFKDNQYTETIEFFSRDSSRVGASLSFTGQVEGNTWHHSGKSSKGDPLHEIWTREQ